MDEGDLQLDEVAISKVIVINIHIYGLIRVKQQSLFLIVSFTVKLDQVQIMG